MDLGWQDFVALGIVFAAIAYLVRLAWNAFARKPTRNHHRRAVESVRRRPARQGNRPPRKRRPVR